MGECHKMVSKRSDFITSADLFEEIVQELKDNGKYPEDLLDYALADEYDSVNLWDYQFDPYFILKAGGSEGYYLDLAIHGIYGDDEKVRTQSLGTMKTLEEDEDGVRRMGQLYAECLIAYEKVVDRHMEDLTRKGYDLDFYREDNVHTGGYSKISSVEAAMEKLARNAKYSKIAYAGLRNNLTREVRWFTTAGEELFLHKFYFTFGSNKNFPYQNGYVVIEAFDLEKAIFKFRDAFPDKTPGTLNCAFYYSEEEWLKADMAMKAEEPHEIIS